MTNLLISLLLLFSSDSGNVSLHHLTIEKIESLNCELNICYAITYADKDNGHWALDLDNPLKLSNFEMNKKYINKYVLIKYIGDIRKDSEIEIISQNLIDLN